MYDIHCHLIPGVDDGADVLNDTLEMLKLAASGNTFGIVCTPHCNIPGVYENYYGNDFVEIIHKLQQLTVKYNIPIQIYPGQEVFLTGPVPQLLQEGKIITINHSIYLLCEFAPDERAENAYRKLKRIRAEGYIPIVAHPERYQFVAEIPDTADKLKSIGAFLQLDKGSIKGVFGSAAEKTAHWLLSTRKADFIASDAHSPYIRTPFLGDIHELVSELYTIEYADFLLHYNPSCVINNKKLYNY